MEPSLPTNPGPLLSISDLTVRFETREGPVSAVRDVSLDVMPGEAVGIVGESGSGKSTLALAVMQLLPSNGSIAAGQIRLDGTDLVGARPSTLRAIRGRRVGIVFQDSSTALNPLLQVGTQITEVMRWHRGLGMREATEYATELLAEVGVTEPRHRLAQFPHQLSGGIRQRVAIAIALAADPEILIADEPTTALDVTVQAQLLDLLIREQARRRMAVILITHDHGVIARTCDRAIVMYAGHIVEQGTVRDVLRSPRHPYTLGLRESVPRLDRAGGTRLPSIPGAPPLIGDLPQGCPFNPRCRFVIDTCRVEDPPLAVLDSGAGTDHRAACWVDVRAAS